MAVVAATRSPPRSPARCPGFITPIGSISCRSASSRSRWARSCFPRSRAACVKATRVANRPSSIGLASRASRHLAGRRRSPGARRRPSSPCSSSMAPSSPRHVRDREAARWLALRASRRRCSPKSCPAFFARSGPPRPCWRRLRRRRDHLRLRLFAARPLRHGGIALRSRSRRARRRLARRACSGSWHCGPERQDAWARRRHSRRGPRHGGRAQGASAHDVPAPRPAHSFATRFGVAHRALRDRSAHVRRARHCFRRHRSRHADGAPAAARSFGRERRRARRDRGGFSSPMGNG